MEYTDLMNAICNFGGPTFTMENENWALYIVNVLEESKTYHKAEGEEFDEGLKILELSSAEEIYTFNWNEYKCYICFEGDYTK